MSAQQDIVCPVENSFIYGFWASVNYLGHNQGGGSLRSDKSYRLCSCLSVQGVHPAQEDSWWDQIIALFQTFWLSQSLISLYRIEERSLWKALCPRYNLFGSLWFVRHMAD